ncbi:hypothetical protein SEA_DISCOKNOWIUM_5 [Mycobacterium phage Discoknowium]|nr:hypothetical protein SEA_DISCOKNOWIUM_5 [Mycobacterium phage Discoknowium]
MPLYTTMSNASDVLVGSTGVRKVYLGDTVVWQRFTPYQLSYTSQGDYHIPINPYADYIDYVMIGSGGSGAGGGLAIPGGGGGGAAWVYGTLRRGVDFPSNASEIWLTLLTPPTGGSGGLSPGSGTDGRPTTLRIDGTSYVVASGGPRAGGWGSGGQAGGAATGGNTNGGRDVSYQGLTGTGGATQSSDGTPGNPYGGGGAGGGLLGSGGRGGYAAAHIGFR